MGEVGSGWGVGNGGASFISTSFSAMRGGVRGRVVTSK